MITRLAFAAMALVTASVSSASAVTILSSNFDGRTVSGDTASNISWVTNGVVDPGDLTVVGQDFSGDPFGAVFFDTVSAQNRLGVDLNTENEGSWFINVSVLTGADALALTSLTLDAFAFNNNGALQNSDREVDVTLSVLSGGTELFSGEAENVQVGANPAGGPFGVEFDLSSIVLGANTGYTLVLGANSDIRNRGNNAGFDNFELTGDVSAVPLPAGLPLMLSALAGLVYLRRLQT